MWIRLPRWQVDAERPDAGAGVEDQLLAARERDLDAGRVAAVAVHLRPRRRDGAARAPDLDLHQPPSPFSESGQKRIIAPDDPCSEATIGNALASIEIRSPLAARIVKVPCAGRPARIASVVARPSTSSGVAVLVERAERRGPLLGAHPARRPRTSARAAPRPPRCRRRRRRRRRAGTRASRCSSAGCGRGSARAASAIAGWTCATGAILPPFSGFDTVNRPTANAYDPARAQAIDALGEYLTAALSRAWRPSELVATRPRRSPRLCLQLADLEDLCCVASLSGISLVQAVYRIPTGFGLGVDPIRSHWRTAALIFARQRCTSWSCPDDVKS